MLVPFKPHAWKGWLLGIACSYVAVADKIVRLDVGNFVEGVRDMILFADSIDLSGS